jgi:hypothetical protein
MKSHDVTDVADLWMGSLSLLLACATAQATTIHLGTDTACDSAYICTNVPNDADAHIAYIDWAAHYERVIVSLNGVTYDSGLWAAKAPTNVAAYAPSGAVIYVTLNFETVQSPCVREGRGIVCPLDVTLVGGTLVTP